jgi:hypothetical protein
LIVIDVGEIVEVIHCWDGGGMLNTHGECCRLLKSGFEFINRRL